MLDDERHPDAKLGIDGNRTLASLYDVMPSAKRVFNRNPAPQPIGAWNHVRIVARADKTVEHWLNGFKVLEYVRGSDDFKAHIAASKFKTTEGFGLADNGRIPAAGPRRQRVVPQHQDPAPAVGRPRRRSGT